MIRRRAAAALTLAALIALPARPALACAGCRNPNLPVARLSTTHLAPGQLRASALVTATGLNVVHEAGCADPADCREVPVEPRFLHDQDIFPGELRVIGELGLSPTWGVELQLPFRVTRTTIRYTDLAGAPYAPLAPDLHHRDETLAGLGDPWLLARAAASLAGTLVTARAGLSWPVGRTEEDPFALGARGLRHQHIQFGTGTFDPLLMLDASRLVGRVNLAAYAQAQLTLYANDEGFRAGNRYFGGVDGGTLLLGRLTGSLGLDLLHEGAERWGGEIQQDGNLGRTELLGGVSFSHPFGKTVATVIARFPLYRHLITGDEPPGRLSAPLTLTLIVSRTFGGS